MVCGGTKGDLVRALGLRTKTTSTLDPMVFSITSPHISCKLFHLNRQVLSVGPFDHTPGFGKLRIEFYEF